MNRLSLVVRLLTLSVAADLSIFAADLTLTDGRTFRDASILSQTPRTVVIQHADGLTGISKTLLPAELSASYPVNEAAALEAERQAAAARARADAFHKAEAEHSARIRLEREQAALHNAQLAALEATQRAAEAEAARIASQRTEVVYEYISFHRSPRYVYTPASDYTCEPRWNENRRDDRFVRHDHSTRRDRHDDSARRNPRSPSVNTPPLPRSAPVNKTQSSSTRLADEPKPVAPISAGYSVMRR